jgi:hypothetical protein
VKDLPLNGRDYLQLSLLSEGTLAPPGQGRTATGINDGVGARAGGFSAGGQRTTDNNYLLDGFDNNTDDTSFDTNQAEVVKPSVDAIQEFKVQTNAYSAEFGRAAGGVALSRHCLRLSPQREAGCKEFFRSCQDTPVQAQRLRIYIWRTRH